MNHYKVFIIFCMMTAALLSSVILFSNSVYAISSQDSITYNENYEKKEDDLSTQFLMTVLPNVADVKSPFKDYETNKYEKDQINYADDYYNYKDNK